MSASLIGHLGSSAFRLSTTTVSMSLAGSCFSSESAPSLFHHGIRGRGGTIFRTALPSIERQVQAEWPIGPIHARRASTTLADLFMPFRFGDVSSAVRASLRSWLNDEIDDGLAHGRQARLRRWTGDFFFSLPLVVA